jgi:hypothetical protein
MHDHCHRCGNELPSQGEASSFCPHCGAPQLYITEQQISSTPETTGTAPPPRPQEIDWRLAIRCAFLAGFIAAALGVGSMAVPVLARLNWLWVVCASAIALTIYQKRRPQALMSGAIGARIGLVVGIVLLACLAISTSAAGVVARYSLHNMTSFDGQLTAMVQQLHTQVEHTAEVGNVPKEDFAYIYAPEFKVWMMLMGFSMVGGIVLVLSTLGGAVGGLLRRRTA